jgi:hypothetical protein
MKNVESRVTPFSPDYSTCSECYADLAIYPGDFPVEEISNFLNVSATKINIVGARSVNSVGRERVVKKPAWFLSSKFDVVSKDLRDHIDWIVGKLKNSPDKLASLQGMDAMKMTLVCVWRSRYGHSGPVLWPEQMKALADLNLECSFDIYFDDLDDEEAAAY